LLDDNNSDVHPTILGKLVFGEEEAEHPVKVGELVVGGAVLVAVSEALFNKLFE
jgi:formyltetrahydrofolate synthetase